MQAMDGVQPTLPGTVRGMPAVVRPATVSLAACRIVALPLGRVLAHEMDSGPAGVPWRRRAGTGRRGTGAALAISATDGLGSGSVIVMLGRDPPGKDAA